MKGGEGEGRIHVSYPGVQQYISASPRQKCIEASEHLLRRPVTDVKISNHI